MSSEQALTGLLLCLAILFGAWWHKGQRRVEQIARRVEARRRRQDEDSAPIGKADRGAQRNRPVLKWWRPEETKRRRDELLAALCVEVAARLRAGASADAAWKGAWLRLAPNSSADLGPSGVPMEVEESDSASARVVVAATRFSAATGAPLADILEQCGESLGDLEQAQSAQRIAFAGPTMSAKVLAGLPVLGLVGGELLGAGPIGWFLSGPLQMLLGALGVALAVAGRLVSKRMISRASSVSREQQFAPIFCDLVNAGIRGGGSVPTVLSSLGAALDDPEYPRVAAELSMGARWDEAWEPTPFGASLLHSALQPGWEEGVAPGTLLLQAATYARRRSLSDAKEAAEKLGVKLALPLGLLLLPSFIILALVPVFFTLVGSQGFLTLGGV